jgi:hypothetical protein
MITHRSPREDAIPLLDPPEIPERWAVGCHISSRRFVIRTEAKEGHPKERSQ